MTMEFIPYRLNPQQWLRADQIMQDEASKPYESRPAVKVVVNRTLGTSFNNVFKTPTFNAVKKRYETYFLGKMGSHGRSLVELGNEMMDLGSMKQLMCTPSELAEDIKNNYFKNSPSALHTREAIESRYRTYFMKWMDADEMMKYAAQPTDNLGIRFRIGAVVDHIKTTFFPMDPLTTETNIQDRYCRLWLGGVMTATEVEAYDQQCIDQEWSTLPRETNVSRPPHQPTNDFETAQESISSTLPLGFPRPPSQQSVVPPNSSPPPQQSVAWSASVQSQPLATPSQVHDSLEPTRQSSVNSHKRIRGNSYDSNAITSNTSYMGRSNSTNSPLESLPPFQKLQRELRDSGFFSSSSSSDSRSLISRMSRLSIEVKPCTMNHSLASSDNPCSVCQYPELQPKPRVYVAPEYASPQRADVVDADEMDNGILTGNANAKSL
ncbi:uncharacterized protein LY89DRAFT_405612 [Mollisia scopiformis]|uniref:Uncharacterized protein n=1 Tax=Mollisia scopiformis TaxID=149040 RepID=A0A132B2D9_MOLSC|nr:uncharacterized protein LY89DRAFT_405612 [Mollisia scopiformis]KUJ06556.1 hypothetical protein LY89DRAFT_405612 [Mollisia scopiformis]